jgi:hypothetical protein
MTIVNLAILWWRFFITVQAACALYTMLYLTSDPTNVNRIVGLTAGIIAVAAGLHQLNKAKAIRLRQRYEVR